MTLLSLTSPIAAARIYMALAPVDMRKGFDGLSMVVQDLLKKDPFRGHLFIFRGKRADLVKILMWDGTGLCLFAKRLERGRFVWAATKDGEVVLTPAQLSMLLEDIDWRFPLRTDQLRRAG
jgi:transposase